MSDTIKDIANELVLQLSGVVEDLSRLKGWNANTLRKAFGMLPTVVKKVESASKALQLGNESKRELAIELVTRLRPAPVWLPDFIYRQILGWAVDSTVAALKDRFE